MPNRWEHWWKDEERRHQILYGLFEKPGNPNAKRIPDTDTYQLAACLYEAVRRLPKAISSANALTKEQRRVLNYSPPFYRLSPQARELLHCKLQRLLETRPLVRCSVNKNTAIPGYSEIFPQVAFDLAATDNRVRSWFMEWWKEQKKKQVAGHRPKTPQAQLRQWSAVELLEYGERTTRSFTREQQKQYRKAINSALPAVGDVVTLLKLAKLSPSQVLLPPLD
jgi:hypothetical protein